MAKSSGTKKTGKSLQNRLSNKLQELKDEEKKLTKYVHHWVVQQGLPVEDPNVTSGMVRQTRNYMQDLRRVRSEIKTLTEL